MIDSKTCLSCRVPHTSTGFKADFACVSGRCYTLGSSHELNSEIKMNVSQIIKKRTVTALSKGPKNVLTGEDRVSFAANILTKDLGVLSETTHLRILLLTDRSGVVVVHGHGPYVGKFILEVLIDLLLARLIIDQLPMLYQHVGTCRLILPVVRRLLELLLEELIASLDEFVGRRVLIT